MDEIYARVLMCSSPSSAGSRTPDPALSDSDAPSSPEQVKSVQVKIELGHRANFRKKVSVEGFTHDWVVFVRGPEGSNLQHFVERVIFHLHDSFPKPKRVVKEPPYQVAESGYAGFMLPIEIWFRNKEEPRKIAFNYDLFLHADGHPPVNHIRCEKLTFQNPTEEFRRKLIKAGGVGILDQNEHARYHNSSPPTSSAVTTITKQSAAVTTPATATSSTTTPTVNTPENKTFTDLFGAPLTKPEVSKKSKPQPQSHSVSKGKGVGGKPRSILGNNERFAANAASSGSAPSTPQSAPSKDARDKVPSPPKEHREKSSKDHRDKHVTPQKDSKSKSKEKSSNKRSADTSPPVQAKKKRHDNHSDSRKDKVHDNDKSKSKHSKDPKKHHKSSKKEKDGKSDGKESSRHDSGESKKSEHKDSSGHQRVGGKRPCPPPQPEVIELSDNEASDIEDDIKPLPASPRSQPVSPLSRPTSPASSLSFSSHHASSISGPLSMLAEIDQMGDDDPPLSPLSKSSPPHLFSKADNPKNSKSSPRTSNKSSPKVSSKPSPKPAHKHLSPKSSKHPAPKVPSPQRTSPRHASPKQPSPKHTPPKLPSTKPSPKDSKKHSSPRTPSDSKSNRHKEKENIVKSKAELKFHSKENKDRRKSPGKDADNRKESKPKGNVPDVTNILDQKASNGECFSVLVELQRRLMGITDRQLLQRIVTLIQSTGNYKVGSTTFDFDLCSLDGGTVNMIRTCLESVS